MDMSEQTVKMKGQAIMGQTTRTGQPVEEVQKVKDRRSSGTKCHVAWQQLG